MRHTARTIVLVAGLLMGSGWLALTSCLTATQVTVELSTDARCIGQNELEGDLFGDVALVVGKSLGREGLTSRGGTDHCEARGQAADRDNWIGTLVVVPGESEGALAEVLVVAGVERPNPSLEGDARRADAQRCLELIGQPGGVEGKACIVQRRILSFVESSKLSLPILLSTRCVAVDCEADETCFDGSCVSARVECSGVSGQCGQPGEGGGSPTTSTTTTSGGGVGGMGATTTSSSGGGMGPTTSTTTTSSSGGGMGPTTSTTTTSSSGGGMGGGSTTSSTTASSTSSGGGSTTSSTTASSTSSGGGMGGGSTTSSTTTTSGGGVAGASAD